MWQEFLWYDDFLDHIEIMLESVGAYWVKDVTPYRDERVRCVLEELVGGGELKLDLESLGRFVHDPADLPDVF